MPYNEQLADRVRAYLAQAKDITIEEKKMFSGLAFLVNGKMCVNISGDNLMCRYDPSLQSIIAEKPGYAPMIMKGKHLDGYCYVHPDALRSLRSLQWWIDTCLAFNSTAKATTKKRSARVK